MTYLKTIFVRSLLLSSEALAAYSLVGILWEPLCGKDPLSLFGYLATGAAVVAANLLYLRKPRATWKLFLVNAALCAIWATALYTTVDHTYPSLLFFPLGLFVIPLVRGYQHSIAPLTASKVQTYAEVTQLYTLLYLIVASFLPGLFRWLPAFLIILILELWALIQFRTTSPNTIFAGGKQNRRTSILIPTAFAGGAAGISWLLFRFRNELRPVLDILRKIIDTTLILLWEFMNLFVKNRTSQAEELLTSGSKTMSEAEPLISGQFNTGTKIILFIFLLFAAVLLLAVIGAALYWIWKHFRKVRRPEIPSGSEWIHPDQNVGIFSKFYLQIRIWTFCKKHKGTPLAALLRLERLGQKYHCGRKANETPREFLLRLQTHLSALPAQQQALFLQLHEDIDSALYGKTQPQLSQETVCSLLSELERNLRSTANSQNT